MLRQEIKNLQNLRENFSVAVFADFEILVFDLLF